MAETVEIKCTCEHKYQDEKYGKGIRVANVKRGNERIKAALYVPFAERSRDNEW
jgi:hypothetical protein